MSFYGWLWRALPGPTAVKAVEATLLALVLIAALFTWVFPALAPLMPFNDITVGE
nr:hypothetical protein [Propionicimonas sp.]